MEPTPNEKREGTQLPGCAEEFIRQVVRKMRYSRRARQDVQAELTAHFEDELKGCADVREREQRARRLLEEFGAAPLLATLCRRAKKRCRPLWAKTIVRSLQAGGVCILLLGLYMIWFVSGRPAVRVDYLALLNQASQPKIAETDNAWPRYEKAIALLVEPSVELRQADVFQRMNDPNSRRWGRLPEEARQALAAWVNQNEAARVEFIAASVKPYCHRAYCYEPNAKDPWLMSLLLPHLSALRDLARLALWQARMERDQGQTRRALDDCLVVARAGRHWQQSGLLVEQLVGLALARMGHEELLGTIAQGNVPPAELARLQEALTTLYPGPFPLIDLEAERIGFLDTVQHVFTDGGPGGGHLIPARSAQLLDAAQDIPGDGYFTVAKLTISTGISLLHAGRNETVAKAGEIFELQKHLATLSPRERRAQNALNTDQIVASLPKFRYSLLHILLPSFERAADLAFEGRTEHEATLTVLALQRYRLEKGSYPPALAELQRTGYLATLPGDPYNQGPLTYKLTNGDFVLYSVGPDFEDNGGTMGRDSKGRLRLWQRNGDTVFWPVGP